MAPPNGIMTECKILNIDGSLNENVFYYFIQDILTASKQGSSLFTSDFDCSKKIQSSPFVDYLGPLEDETIYPEFHKIWKKRYESAVKALDVPGDFRNLKFFIGPGNEQQPPGLVDPSAIAPLIDQPLPPGVGAELSPLLVLVSLPAPFLSAKIPAYTAQYFPGHVAKFSASGPNAPIAANAEIIAKIQSITPDQVQVKPDGFKVDQTLLLNGYTDQYEFDVSLQKWIKSTYDKLLTEPNVSQLFKVVFLAMAKDIVGSIKSPSLISTICKIASIDQPSIRDANTEQLIYTQIFFQHMVRLFALVYVGQCIGNGLLVKALAATPLPAEAKLNNLPAAGLGIQVDPPEEPKNEKFEFKKSTSRRGKILKIIENLLGPPDPTGPGISSSGPNSGKYKQFDPNYSTIEEKIAKGEITITKETKDDKGKTVTTTEIVTSVDQIGEFTWAIKSPTGADGYNAGGLKSIYYGKNADDPSFKPAKDAWAALIAKEPKKENKEKLTKKSVPFKASGSITNKSIPRVTNCGMLPPYILKELGIKNPQKGEPRDLSTGFVTYKDKRFPNVSSTHGFLESGPLNPYWIGKGLEKHESKQFGKPWKDSTITGDFIHRDIKTREKNGPRPGDFFIIGNVQKPNPKDPELSTWEVKHVGVIVDPNYPTPSSPQGIGWLTADAGQGNFGFNEAVKYRQRPIIYTGTSILIAGEPNQGKPGDNPWVQVLGWLDVDMIPIKDEKYI